MRFLQSTGGRKFCFTVLISLALLAAASGGVHMGLLTGEHWASTVSAIQILGIAYLGANVAEGAVQKFGKKDGEA